MMNNENGRSMVEMLGVLAIIGVLSVAGIAGYTMAMNKFRANEILNIASQTVMMAKSANMGAGASTSFTAFGSGNDSANLTAPAYMSGGNVTVTNANGDTPSVAITGVTGGSSSGICKAVVAANPGENSNIYNITSCS